LSRSIDFFSLASSRFLVARVKRSATRESRSVAPGLRFAPSGLL
jgi:hypothetical protein